jgi:hydrogenase maturation factor
MSGYECASDHCVTCSDEGVAMRVVEVRAEALARCVDEAGGGSEDVMTDLVGQVATGERLLVHAGVALTRLGRDGLEEGGE